MSVKAEGMGSGKASNGMIILYDRERGPMGSAPYIGPRRGDGPIFEVSVSHLDAKERPGKLPMHAIFIIQIIAAATIDFSLIQA